MNIPAKLRLFCCVLGVLALPCRAASAQALHVNEAIGYRIRLPEDYVAAGKDIAALFDVAIANDPYFIEIFLCKKPLRCEGGDVFYRRLTTYYFPERTAADLAKEKAERDAAEQKEGGDKGAAARRGPAKIYQGFKEYASDRIRGFYFEEEKEMKVAGFPATVYEMRFEKLTGTPKRYMVCSYRVPGGEFAVMFTCTEEHFRQTRPEFHRTFESFKMLSPAGLKAPEAPAPTAKESAPAPAAGAGEPSVEELVKQRDEAFQQAIDGLEKGWRHVQGEHFLVLHETDAKYARKVLRHAEALGEWLAGAFPEFGMGYVQDAIIRVRAAGSPRAPAAESGAGGLRRVRVFTVRQPEKDPDSSRFAGLSIALLHAWLEQRNEPLFRHLPAWLRTGLDALVADAQVSGSRLDFAIDAGEARALAALFQAEEAQRKSGAGEPVVRPLSEIVGAASHDLLAGRGGGAAAVQASILVRYLIDGPGARAAETEVLLAHYVGHLHDLVETLEERLAAEKKQREELEKMKGDRSEDQRLQAEDEEYKRKREQAAGRDARELLQNAFDLTFGGWSAQDWEELDRSCRAFAK
ncbi:MAG: hypothetical protein HY812_14345, partial [Planctomycetes bacterium]|nr:hypothetical protein [Planctomycetota bacterium]